MTVTAVNKDAEALSMAITAEFEATPERVWQLWADPRQLERWWGPPTYPATFEQHDLRPGGRVSYYMTGPTGDTPRGYWDVEAVDPPRSLVVRDSFADEAGNPADGLPTSLMRVAIEEAGEGRTTMTITTQFQDQAAMEQVIAMGMEEGMTQAMGQIDAILAEDGASAGAGGGGY